MLNEAICLYLGLVRPCFLPRPSSCIPVRSSRNLLRHHLHISMFPNQDSGTLGRLLNSKVLGISLAHSDDCHLHSRRTQSCLGANGDVWLIPTGIFRPHPWQPPNSQHATSHTVPNNPCGVLTATVRIYCSSISL